MSDIDREAAIVLGVCPAGHLSARTVEVVAAQATDLDLAVVAAVTAAARAPVVAVPAAWTGRPADSVSTS